MAAQDLRVDGNAVAGVLQEIFIQEMTSARVKCDGCGAVEPIGAEHVYMNGPGIVVRCCHCDGVLLVLTQRGERYLIGFQDVAWLRI